MIDLYCYALVGVLVLFVAYKVIKKVNKKKALGNNKLPTIKETYPTNEK